MGNLSKSFMGPAEASDLARGFSGATAMKINIPFTGGPGYDVTMGQPGNSITSGNTYDGPNGMGSI